MLSLTPFTSPKQVSSIDSIMRLNFRQGIVQALAISGQPAFLTYSSLNNSITINITTTRVIVSAAYKDDNYLTEQRETIVNAWGPLTWLVDSWGPQIANPTYYLYWDWNIGTGLVTRSYTPWAPVFSAAPLHPSVDQHWFDYIDNVMKVWDGSMWIPTIRVFAGSVAIDENLHTGTITHNPLGSQVELSYPGSLPGIVEAGWVIYGMDMKAIRTSTGQLFTSVTNSNTYHGSFSSPIKLELLSSQARAEEPIPAFYAVSNTGDGRLVLADNLDINRSPIGIIDQDLIPGESAEIISYGLVYNDQWQWDPTLGKNLYCGADGVLVQGFPQSAGILIGWIIDVNSALIDINSVGAAGPAGGSQGPVGPVGPTGPQGSGPTGPAGTTLSQIPYDFLYASFSTILPSSPVGGSLVTKNLTLPMGLPGSYSQCVIAPIADSFVDILVNNTVYGQIFFASGSTVGVFTFPNAVSLLANDILNITAHDSSQFDISGTMTNLYVSINAIYAL